MKPYYQDDHVTLYHGDCIEVMRSMSDSSIDSIVTDPPYGLGFAGKKWDALPPGEEWASECLRVLKPGGHMLAFGGTRTWHRLTVAVEDAGIEIRDNIAWMYGTGFPKSRASLKPAFEPIIVGRKPYKGSLTENEDRYGTGVLNIDECRVGGAVGNGLGRWPSNVVLDEESAEMLDRQSGVLKSGALSPYTPNHQDPSSWRISGSKEYESPASTGGASRFYYVAKAPGRERPTFNGVKHATVKPLTLMRHLVRLVTPAGGIALDTFAGSGTTIEAATLEGYKSIGIEREAEYLPLIEARIARSKPDNQSTLDLGDIA